MSFHYLSVVSASLVISNSERDFMPLLQKYLFVPVPSLAYTYTTLHTAFFEAVKLNDVAAMSSLLAKGVDIDGRDPQSIRIGLTTPGYSAMHWASLHGNYEVVIVGCHCHS